MDDHHPLTSLEVAQQDIFTSEERVAHQTAAIAKLAAEGKDTRDEEELLDALQKGLDLLRKDVAVLQGPACNQGNKFRVMHYEQR